ncbi:Plakophilin-3 [Plecturocebus cupreus]
MRECHGLVDALVTYINHALDVGKCEDKVRAMLRRGSRGPARRRPDPRPCPQRVENAVCVLRNLSYCLYDKMPPFALQRLEGRGRRDLAGAPPGEMVGCFTMQSWRLREPRPSQLPLTADALNFAEVSKYPKGLEWLWSPQIVGLYNRLLQCCELNRHTTEAAAGALVAGGCRDPTVAGSPQLAGVLSRLALEQERILNPLLDRVHTADHHQLCSLTGLIQNLSRNVQNKDEMCESSSPVPALLGPHTLRGGSQPPGPADKTGTQLRGEGRGRPCPGYWTTKVVSHVIEKLLGSVGEKSPSAKVLVNIIAVLNNMVVASPITARDLLYFDGLRKLVFIKKKWDSPDSEKSSRAASSLLANLWQYNKLH